MTYDREQVIKFWKETGLDDRRKRKQIEELCRITGNDLDHIKPLSLGGPDCWWNLQPLSPTRNRSKGAGFPEADRKTYEQALAKLPEDYRARVEENVRALLNKEDPICAPAPRLFRPKQKQPSKPS